MKRMCIFVLALGFGLACFASNLDTCYTNSQGKVVYYRTNAVEIARTLTARGKIVEGYPVHPVSVNPAQYSEIDAILAAATNIVFIPFHKEYPRAAKRYLDNLRSSGNSIGLVNFLENEWFGDKSVKCRAACHIAKLDIINWNLRETPWVTYNNVYQLDGIKKSTVSLANKTTKAKIRSEGKSFVVKDGVNPVQERLDALTKALDAPYFAGLEAACTNCGIVVSSDFRKHFPTPAQVTELKRQVLFGEQEFTDVNKVFLMTALGIEGYNRFVKEYNGEN